MNVFVLCTGRCGSRSFAMACRHITNFTVCHEGNKRLRNEKDERPYSVLRFPENHIEVDNRLSWFLGALDKNYGREALYVHLLRDREEVAKSYSNRGPQSIVFAFAFSILQYYDQALEMSEEERFQIGLQYCDTVNSNIESFLRDKPHQIKMWLHDIEASFPLFWDKIGALGDMPAALAELKVRHNASNQKSSLDWTPQSYLTRVLNQSRKREGAESEAETIASLKLLLRSRERRKPQKPQNSSDS